MANSSFKRVSYTEAVALLEEAVAAGKKKFEYPVSWGIDLQVRGWWVAGWEELGRWLGSVFGRGCLSTRCHGASNWTAIHAPF